MHLHSALLQAAPPPSSACRRWWTLRSTCAHPATASRAPSMPRSALACLPTHSHHGAPSRPGLGQPPPLGRAHSEPPAAVAAAEVLRVGLGVGRRFSRGGLRQRHLQLQLRAGARACGPSWCRLSTRAGRTTRRTGRRWACGGCQWAGRIASLDGLEGWLVACVRGACLVLLMFGCLLSHAFLQPPYALCCTCWCCCACQNLPPA
jgi:hypothetical protein